MKGLIILMQLTKEEALALLKSLVANNQFNIAFRRAQHAFPVTTSVAKIIVANLEITDFEKYEEDDNARYSGEYCWSFMTEQNDKYYLKFKFQNTDSWVKFVSFHIAVY